MHLPDEIAGTYFAQAREYDAANGRFTGEDPVHGNANWYVYASGNPLKYRDPMGLADMSDADAGTSMDFQKLQFKAENGEDYIIWMWKGDYLNLGAGAETGIYKDPVLNGLHWQAAVDDALPMSISVTYEGEEVISYSPEEPQWWITGFDPMVPDVSANDLLVEGSIDFSGDENLWNGFKKAYEEDDEYDLTFDEENKIVTYRW